MKVNTIEHSNPNFKMAVKFSNGTTLKDLQKHVIKNAAIKDNKTVLHGLDKLIKNNANNKHFDIIFDKINNGTYDIVAKTLSAKFIQNYVDMKEEIIDNTLSKIIKYKKNNNIIANTKNPISKAYHKLQNLLLEISLKINIAQDPTKSLPEDLQSINNNVAKYTNIAENGGRITIYSITPSKKN